MSSFASFSELAFCEAPRLNFVSANLRRLAQARTANQSVFLELTGREVSQTTLDQVLPNVGGNLTPFASVPFSSLTLPRIQRQQKQFLYGTRPWSGRPTDTVRPNKRSSPRVMSAGRITRSIPVEATNLRRGQRNIGDATLANPDGGLDELLTNYSLVGEKIRAFLAEPGADAGEWLLLYEAVVSGVEATRKNVRLSITTVQDELGRELQLRCYTGSGGLAGDSNVAGRKKPMALGECAYVDPVLISAADNIYAVNDGPIYSIDEVLEGGLAYTSTTDYPTFDALRLASLDAGQYATCLAFGLVRIQTNIAGLVYPLRISLRGDASGAGYASSTGTILYRLARNRAFLSASQLDVDSFAALPRGSVGFYSNGTENYSVEDVFNRLLRGAVAYFGVGRGDKLQVGRVIPPERRLNTLNLVADQVFDLRVEPRPDQPRVSQPYTYAPTFAPLTTDQVAPGASASTAERLTQDAFTDTVFDYSPLSLSPLVQSTLPTYFTAQESAQAAAFDALSFASTQRIPLRANLGRLGLLVDLGGVFGLEADRYQQNYRGFVYEQEDLLDATVKSRVMALG